MAIEGFVSLLGSFASLIGLSVQLYDRTNQNSSSNDKKRLGIFISLTDITSTWKRIHNEYHNMNPEINALVIKLSDGNGGFKSGSDLSEKEVEKLFKQSNQISLKSLKFRSNMEIYFDDPKGRLAIDKEDVRKNIRLIRDKLGLNVSQSVDLIHQNQINAIEAHESVCEFFDVLAPRLRMSSWSASDRDIVLNSFVNFPRDFNYVIMYCDVILLRVIDLYEFVAKDIISEVNK